jgi:DNA repair protein RecO
MITFKDNVIVLNRTNYGESDRIVNAMTTSGQKISYIAKGVRKLKSKLVASCELFVVSEITYIKGKSDLFTVSSARIINQYGNFLSDLDKVTTAYDIIKTINKRTPNDAGQVYYNILHSMLMALDGGMSAKQVELWAYCNILKESGHSLRLTSQIDNSPFTEKTMYIFDAENGGFIRHDYGVYSSDHIKLLKLCHNNSPNLVARVNNGTNLSAQLNPFIKQFVETTH